MRIIIKYRGTYRVYLHKDIDGNDSPNQDDTYLKCRGGITINRYDENTLKIYFPSNNVAENRVATLILVGVELKLYQQGDKESTYLFTESNLSEVANVVTPNTKGAKKSPKTKKKRDMTEEEREVLRQRMINIRKDINKGK